MGLFTLFTVGKALISGVDSISKHQKQQGAKRDLRNAENQLKEMEENRQKVVNPYEGYENLSSLIENNTMMTIK